MNLIAHRGHWHRNPAMQNSPAAVRAAFACGWGVEIDVNTRDGSAVIGHGGHHEPSCLLETWLPAVRGGFSSSRMRSAWRSAPVLLDVKASVMPDVFNAFDSRLASYWFDHELVDPDLPQRCPEGRYLARCTNPADFDAALTAPWAAGVWLDQPAETWVDLPTLRRCLAANRIPFVVSPELHHRPIELAAWRTWDYPGVWVCTDLPHLAAALAADEDLHPSDPWWDVHA